jgi:branched-chain amino acid aminotransferase
MNPVDTRAPSLTWTFVDGHWHEGNPPLIGPRSHAFWLGSTVFDGARWFDGVAPDLDLHCARVNRSAQTMGMRPGMAAETIEHLVREGRLHSTDVLGRTWRLHGRAGGPGFHTLRALPL